MMRIATLPPTRGKCSLCDHLCDGADRNLRDGDAWMLDILWPTGGLLLCHWCAIRVRDFAPEGRS